MPGISSRKPLEQDGLTPWLWMSWQKRYKKSGSASHKRNWDVLCLVRSLPRICRAVIQAKGGSTRYWFSTNFDVFIVKRRDLCYYKMKCLTRYLPQFPSAFCYFLIRTWKLNERIFYPQVIVTATMTLFFHRLICKFPWSDYIPSRINLSNFNEIH